MSEKNKLRVIEGGRNNTEKEPRRDRAKQFVQLKLHNFKYMDLDSAADFLISTSSALRKKLVVSADKRRQMIDMCIGAPLGKYAIKQPTHQNAITSQTRS